MNTSGMDHCGTSFLQICATSLYHSEDVKAVLYLTFTLALFIITQITLTSVTIDHELGWLFLTTLISTPLKTVFLLLLGQAPLRYLGFLNDEIISIFDITKLGMVGGLILVIPHFAFKAKLIEDPSNSETGAYNQQNMDSMELDDSKLKSFMVLLAREINQVLFGLIFGVVVMWRFNSKFREVVLNQVALDRLLVSTVLGPCILFVTAFVLGFTVLFLRDMYLFAKVVGPDFVRRNLKGRSSIYNSRDYD